MVYSFNEYKRVFDTPAKSQQEKVIVEKIMKLLNNNKYDNLDEFIAKNNNYQDFLKKNKMDYVVKHFGNTLGEEDYNKILSSLKSLTIEKNSFAKENIKTTTIDDRQFNSYKGENKTYFIDNSITDKKIENQMKDMQPTQESFQTNDAKKNTENMFKELESNKKEGLDLHFLNEINRDLLNKDEFDIYRCAVNYQVDNTFLVRLDIKKGVMVDEDDNIIKVENIDGKYVIKNENTDTKEKTDTKDKVMTLKINPNTIYSNIAS